MGNIRKLPPETHDRSCPKMAKIFTAVGGTVGRVYGLDRIQAHHHKKEGQIMITQLQIEAYAESKRGTCLEVFSSIVGTDSKATKNMAIAVSEMSCKKVLESFTDGGNVLKSSAVSIAVQQMEIETLMDFASAVDAKLQGEFKHRIISKTEWLRNIGLRLIAFMYDLDYARLKSLRSCDRDLYYEVGDAIFLSGVYLALQDGN